MAPQDNAPHPCPAYICRRNRTSGNVMSKPTSDELKALILATGGEIESMTDTLAEEVAHLDEAAADRIRAIGAELASELRNVGRNFGGKPAN